MVKVFTTNKNGKIEFTKEELEKLLNEVWLDGKNASSWYYWRSPGITTFPYITTTCSGSTATVGSTEYINGSTDVTTIKIGE